MRISVVVETWNIDSDAGELARQLDRLAPQLGDAELVVTHAGLSAGSRATLEMRIGRVITWVELPRDAGYYEHKNAGFDAATGDLVAFLDGDCAPCEGWLTALVAPLARGAQVAAGATSYAGPLAPLANALDFPYFDWADKHHRFAAGSAHATRAVRNFFANNVAFAREAFATRRYPTIEPMFHGQCQVLALRLVEAGIAIAYVPDARVTHAWPESARDFIETRLLRGADTTQLIPHVLGTYAPKARTAAMALGPLPALGVLALRAVTGSIAALRDGPRLRGLALVAAVTALDAVGAMAASLVYRTLAPPTVRTTRMPTRSHAVMRHAA